MDGFFWFMLGVATALLILYILMMTSDIIKMPGERLRDKILKKVPKSSFCNAGYLYFLYDEHTMGINIDDFNEDKLYNIHIIDNKTDNVKYVGNNVMSENIINYLNKYIDIHNSHILEEDDNIDNDISNTEIEDISTDDILDKILRDGIESLSEKEREILDKQKNNG
jgi:hypothetical protein